MLYGSRYCPHCDCDVSCPFCHGKQADAVWVYSNAPGAAAASTLVADRCSRCGGSGIRPDHICARIFDDFPSSWHLDTLRMHIEDATYCIAGSRSIDLNLGCHADSGSGGLPVSIEPKLRTFTDLPSSAVLHNWSPFPGRFGPTLHTLVSSAITVEAPGYDAFEDELDCSWRGRIDDWIERGQTAVRRSGRLRLLRVVLGTV